MVYGWDAYKVMQMRQSYGYTWVPNAAQPAVPVIPGVNFPNDIGLRPYDPDHPPAGSIKVSTDIADYPPLDPLEGQVVRLRPASYVGQTTGGGFYWSLPDDPAEDLEVVEDARGTFICHRTPWGKYYEKKV
jgi:hypothetical protein